jgi:hypothetical protein
MIWQALPVGEAGHGYRRAAVRRRLPASTVRDWLRRFDVRDKIDFPPAVRARTRDRSALLVVGHSVLVMG